jgi:hypothetical protein
MFCWMIHEALFENCAGLLNLLWRWNRRFMNELKITSLNFFLFKDTIYALSFVALRTIVRIIFKMVVVCGTEFTRII